MPGISTCLKYPNRNQIKCQLLVRWVQLHKLYLLIVKLVVLYRSMISLNLCFWSSMSGSFLYFLERVRIIFQLLNFIGFVIKCPIQWPLFKLNMAKLLVGILHYLGTLVRNTGQLIRLCKALYFRLIWEKDIV